MDITVCRGGVCPYKTTCRRFEDYDRAISSGDYCLFAELPLEINNGEYTCKMYWGWREQEIFNQLQRITNNQ